MPMASEATGLGLGPSPSDPFPCVSEWPRPAVSEPLPQADATEDLRGGAGLGRKKKTPLTKIHDSKWMRQCESSGGELFICLSLFPVNLSVKWDQNICLLLNRSRVLSGKNDKAGGMRFCRLALIYFWGNGLARQPQAPLLIASSFSSRNALELFVDVCALWGKEQQNLLQEKERKKRKRPLSLIYQKRSITSVHAPAGINSSIRGKKLVSPWLKNIQDTEPGLQPFSISLVTLTLWALDSGEKV